MGKEHYLVFFVCLGKKTSFNNIIALVLLLGLQIIKQWIKLMQCATKHGFMESKGGMDGKASFPLKVPYK